MRNRVAALENIVWLSTRLAVRKVTTL